MTTSGGARWSRSETSRWAESTGWLVGCNFTPSTAGNQLEMLQRETFDAATIDRELGWAAGLGMNTIRLYLHDLLFDANKLQFFDTIDEMLGIASGHGIRTIPVLFDGVWNPEPKLGPQPEPRPRRHNSTWVQSPGSRVLHDGSQWPRLEAYVVETIARFGSDERVVMWDLFNEPDQIDAITLMTGSREEKAAAATALVEQVFDWARVANPTQPLTVGVWEYDEAGQTVPNELNRVALERSDVISFHCYEPRARLETVIDALATHGRPLVCTEWLARSSGSTADLLEVFQSRGVGAINWGLVDGRTQTRFPWTSWFEQVEDDAPWFHELLHSDGRPYDEAEAALFRQVTRATQAR